MSGGKLNAAQKKALTTVAVTTASLGLMYIVFQNRTRIIKNLKYFYDIRNPLRHKHVEIVDNIEDCNRVVNTLKQHCEEYRVLGFDCEWVTVGGTRRRAALLQLASHRGLCALIRLCHLTAFPQNLRDLLEDENILKVGVEPADDAAKLLFDYGLPVLSTLDLRFLAVHGKRKAEGLGRLAKTFLNVELDKNWRIRCSNWEAQVLTENQIDYAANDSLVAVEIFKKLSQEIHPRHFWHWSQSSRNEFFDICLPYIDVNFKTGLAETLTVSQKNTINGHAKNNQIKKLNIRKFSSRSTVLYDNCFLQAPDGEILCACERKKAQWYIDQNLGESVTENPFTVRLNFEPAGRAVGEVGQYYATAKENQCVVCGKKDAYIRKNVVPREYRKHFPIIMKSHTSHDVLLLCPICHQLSNISDLKIRQKLSQICNAPLTNDEGNIKYRENPKLRKLKSAARAVLRNSEKIPVNRLEVLKNNILEHYPEGTIITTELLENAADIDVLTPMENYINHGQKVVTEYQEKLGGLVILEKLWREHFINTMKPKYLPPLWSITHNKNRLEIRANEGRIEKDDMLLAGLDPGTLLTATTRNVNQIIDYDPAPVTTFNDDQLIEIKN